MKTVLLVSAIILAAVSFVAQVTATSANQTTNVCVANPDPATPDFNQVDTPSAGAAVSSPVTVRGRILAFEATFRVTIFDAAGRTIADAQGMSSDGTMLSPFEVQVPFSVSTETQACMWVFENSARDGLPIHVRQIPLRLLPASAGLPQTGDDSASDSVTWPAVVSLSGILLALCGGTIAFAAAKRR